MKIELTDEELKLLTELLSLDMDKIGFDDEEAEILYGIHKKLIE